LSTRASFRSQLLGADSLPEYESALGCVGWSWLAGFDFGAFLQRGLARKFYAAFIINPNALDPNNIPDFGNVLGPFDTEIRQLRNVHESFPAWQNFHKCAEFFRGDYTALIGLTDLDLAGHAADNFFRARHAFAAGRVDVYGAIIFDINLSTGLRDDPLDSLPAGADERADLLGIDFYRLDSGRVFR